MKPVEDQTDEKEITTMAVKNLVISREGDEVNQLDTTADSSDSDEDEIVADSNLSSEDGLEEAVLEKVGSCFLSHI